MCIRNIEKYVSFLFQFVRSLLQLIYMFCSQNVDQNKLNHTVENQNESLSYSADLLVLQQKIVIGNLISRHSYLQ